MKTSRTLTAAVAAAFFGMLTVVMPASSQAQGAATVHGHVTNPAGLPLSNGDVRFTTDKNPSAPDAKFAYDFPLDGQGNYTGKIDKPGNYIGVVFQAGNHVDYSPQTAIAAGEDKTIDFDMSRKEYLDKMTPAEKEQLEEYKKQAAAAMAANSKIANLNAMLKQARADREAGNFDAAIKAMTDATTAKPDEPILWEELGDDQLGQATAAQKASRTDPTLADKFGTAIASYQKALTLETAKAKPDPKAIAATQNQLGQAYGRQGKTKEASDAYEAAAKADPTQAGMYYFNEAATAFNANSMDEAAAAAQKAVTADPTKADAYYIEGQALIQKATVDPKTNKITAPPGCVEAYQKYLELAPTGPHAEEVKGILQGIGASVATGYKAGKK
ncbi:MAG TPA: tetratricopeptide repeat protein [Acidobacteriaceae bacterium]|nr:tetratricopeptide repeat protein [Acidobacteriaceae bacterium]